MNVGEFELSIVVDGHPLAEWRDRESDATWVAATHGSEFSLLLRNRTGGRVLAVPSVDGISVMDGQPASYWSGGYILKPHSQVVVPGWRLDERSVAHFQFGTAAEGYAHTMGHSPGNIGVVAAAFFAEMRHRPQAMYAAPVKGFLAAPPLRPSSGRKHNTDDMAVQFGAKLAHQVAVRPFERASDKPAAVISIRYDTQRGLQDRGIGCPTPPGWRAESADAHATPYGTDGREHHRADSGRGRQTGTHPAESEGFRLEQIAFEAKRFLDPTTHLASPPLRFDEPLESPWGEVGLCDWGYFNPMGPTVCDLRLLHAGRIGTDLLVLHVAHPFSPWCAVYGLFPSDLRDEQGSVGASLLRLFWRNGSGELPLLGSLPTYIRVPDGSPLKPTDVYDLFMAVLPKVDCGDLDRRCTPMRKHWCKPWDRATEEFESALSGAPQIPMVTTADGKPGPDRRKFDEWFRLITHPDHVAAELREMPAAWQGAISFRRGDFGTK